MMCPFCQCANPSSARICRVCAGPLHAKTPPIAVAPIAVAPIAVAPVAVAPVAVAPIAVAPIAVAPDITEVARRNFDVGALPLVHASFFLDENSRVCLICAYGTVRLWDAQTNELREVLAKRRFRKSGAISCALVAPDFVAMGAETGEVRWHALVGRERKKPASHVGRVLALAASATHFYSGGSDGVIWATQWDDKKSKSRALIEGLGALRTFAVSPDAQAGATLVAVGCDDGAVQLWRPNDEQTAMRLDWTRSGHAAPLEFVLFSPNGHMILSRDAAGHLCLWAAQTSYQLPLAPGAQSSQIAPAFSPDSRYLAVLNAENNVEIWDIATEKRRHVLPASSEKTRFLAFASTSKSPNSASTSMLVAGEREIAIWKVS